MSKREIRLSVLELEKLGVTLASPQYPDTKAEENSRRLTACWNACEGISTENLEYSLPVKELVQQCNEAIWQRDELLAALLWVLWHHQGGSSDTGQPIRKLLGIGQHDRLTDDQLRLAKSFIASVKGGVVNQQVRCDNCNQVVTQGEAKTLFCSGEINGVRRHVISLCPSCVPTKKDRGAA